MEDSDVIINSISDYCPICRCLKTCKVFHFDEETGNSMSQICDPCKARALCYEVVNNTISDVWCSNCGVKYHPKSI